MKAKTKKPTPPPPRPAYMPPSEALLSRSQVATLLGVMPRTFDRMVAAGQYPRCDLRVPDPEKGDPRWRVASHDAWVRRRSGAEEVDHPGGI